MNETLSSKKLLREYGIFLAFAVFALSLIFVSAFIFRKRGEETLKNELQFFLDKKSEEKISLGKKITLDSFADFHAHVFETGTSHIILLRVQTLYGPEIGVFSYGKNANTKLLGIFPSSISKDNLSVQKQNFSYWLSRIPHVLQEKVGN